MRRRLWFSVAMLAAGASLLVAASFASASGASPSIHKGGTLKIGTTGNLDSVRPGDRLRDDVVVVRVLDQGEPVHVS